MEDHLYKYLSLYKRLPYSVKRLLGGIYNLQPRTIRYGSFYKEYMKRAKFFAGLDNMDQIHQEQSRLLIPYVNDAIENIPFYKSFGKLDTMEQLESYPVIDKYNIIHSLHEFLHPGLSQKRLMTRTSGSSGVPTEFYLEKGISRSKEKAHFDWYWGQSGYKPNDRTVVLRGGPLRGNALYEYNAIDNLLNVSCSTLNEENVDLAVQRINRFNPLFIQGYPSSLQAFTTLLQASTHSLDVSLKAMFLGSEQLSDSDRLYFEQYYHTRTVHWYGHSERAVHGGDCPFSRDFHFFPAYGYMELLDENNRQVTEPGLEGRIVATGYDNRVMPFIRYDTGDIGILSANKECKCGFKGISLSRISGRLKEFIVLSDQTTISMISFRQLAHLEAFKKIKEMQIIQKGIGEIELRLVARPDFDKKDEQAVQKELVKNGNNKVQVEISYADAIPKTSTGKNIFFVSHLQ